MTLTLTHGDNEILLCTLCLRGNHEEEGQGVRKKEEGRTESRERGAERIHTRIYLLVFVQQRIIRIIYAAHSYSSSLGVWRLIEHPRTHYNTAVL